MGGRLIRRHQRLRRRSSWRLVWAPSIYRCTAVCNDVGWPDRCVRLMLVNFLSYFLLHCPFVPSLSMCKSNLRVRAHCVRYKKRVCMPLYNAFLSHWQAKCRLATSTTTTPCMRSCMRTLRRPSCTLPPCLPRCSRRSRAIRCAGRTCYQIPTMHMWPWWFFFHCLYAISARVLTL